MKDSVQTIMKNSNRLLEKALAYSDRLDIYHKSAELLDTQSKMKLLFESNYESKALDEAKYVCLRAYLNLEYALVRYDENIKASYYARCEVKDLYTKCRKIIAEYLGRNEQKLLTSFVANCYKRVCTLRDDAILSTNAMSMEEVKKVREMYDTEVTKIKGNQSQ